MIIQITFTNSRGTSVMTETTLGEFFLDNPRFEGLKDHITTMMEEQGTWYPDAGVVMRKVRSACLDLPSPAELSLA